MTRHFARWTLISAFVIGLVAVGGPSPADALSGCNKGPSANTADVSLDQGTTATITGGNLVVTYTVNVRNVGPCQMPTLTIQDTLPASTGTWAIVATTPSSWISGCPVPPSGSTPGSFTCFLNAGLGAQGSGSLSVQVTFTGTTPSDTTNIVQITAPIATTDGGTCNTTTSICEVNTDNDKSWGAFLVGTLQLVDGVAAGQFQAIQGPGTGVSAQVTRSSHSTCPAGITCMGQGAHITVIDPTTGLPYVSTTAPLTFVFFFDQATYGKPSQIKIVHIINSGPFAGTYTLANCKGNNLPPWGCISARSTQTIGPVTYSVITVTTPQNDDWFGGP